MPKRATPGDEAAIRAALTPTLRAALHELRELHNIWSWQCSPLADVFQQSAVMLLAAELVVQSGISDKDAVDHAAIMLGLSPDTVRARGKRWPRESRTLCTPTPRGWSPTFAADTDRREAA